jgi:PKD domain
VLRGSWCVALAVVLLFTASGLGASADAVAPHAPAAVGVPTGDGLTANATAVVGPGTWNCGQGQQTVDLFARALSGVAPYRYLWSFGDGSPASTEQDPVHTYQNLLHFTANLTVTDADNRTAEAQVAAGWGIPLTCSSSAPYDGAGIALYLALVGAVALAVVLVIRRQRRPPAP